MHDNHRPFVFPEIWNNDDSMYALMQPIRRSKFVDPVSYNTKVTFWKKLLISYVSDQNVFVLNKHSTQHLFSRYFTEEGLDMVPQSIDEVYDELLKETQVKPYIPRKTFLINIAQTAYTYLLQKPMSWSYQYLTGKSDSNSTSSSTDQTYVFDQFAAKAANEFIQWFHKKYEHKRLISSSFVYKNEDFLNSLEQFFCHPSSREYIYDYLENTCCCINTELLKLQNSSTSINIVRVAENTATKPIKPADVESSKAEAAALTGIIQLKLTIERVEKEEKKLQLNIEQRRVQIKQLLVNKKTSEAKSLLQRTKVLGRALSQKQIQLQNLETIQLDIESATENRNILNTLSDANLALKQSLGADSVSKADSIMNDVLDSIHDNQEVMDSIALFGHVNHDRWDSDDLQSELDDILNPKSATLVGEDEKELELQFEALDVCDDKLAHLPELNMDSKNMDRSAYN